MFISSLEAFSLVKEKFNNCTKEEFHHWIITGDIEAYIEPKKSTPFRTLGNREKYWYPSTFFFIEEDILKFPDQGFTGRYLTYNQLIDRWSSKNNALDPESIISDHFNRDKTGGIITGSMVLGTRGYLGLTCRGLFQTLAENYKDGLFREKEVEVFEAWMFGEAPEKNTTIQNEATPNNTIETTLSNDTSDWSEYFDPLPISGIALLFPIKGKDEEQNLLTWKKRADQASKNGLKKYRAIKQGSGKNKFNPWLVGEWLVNKGYITREHAQRKLANNLPQENSHIKEYILE